MINLMAAWHCIHTNNQWKVQKQSAYKVYWRQNSAYENVITPASWRICKTWISSTGLEPLVVARLNVRPSEAAAAALLLAGFGPWCACSAAAARSRRHWSLRVSIARRHRSTIAPTDCKVYSTNTSSSNYWLMAGKLTTSFSSTQSSIPLGHGKSSTALSDWGYCMVAYGRWRSVTLRWVSYAELYPLFNFFVNTA